MRILILAALLFPASFAGADTISLTNGGSTTIGNTTVTCQAGGGSSGNSYCDCRYSGGGPGYQYYSDIFKVVPLPNGQEHLQQLTFHAYSCNSGSPSLGCDWAAPCKRGLLANPPPGC